MPLSDHRPGGNNGQPYYTKDRKTGNLRMIGDDHAPPPAVNQPGRQTGGPTGTRRPVGGSPPPSVAPPPGYAPPMYPPAYPPAYPPPAYPPAYYPPQYADPYYEDEYYEDEYYDDGAEEVYESDSPPGGVSVSGWFDAVIASSKGVARVVRANRNEIMIAATLIVPGAGQALIGVATLEDMIVRARKGDQQALLEIAKLRQSANAGDKDAKKAIQTAKKIDQKLQSK